VREWLIDALAAPISRAAFQSRGRTNPCDVVGPIRPIDRDFKHGANAHVQQRRRAWINGRHRRGHVGEELAVEAARAYPPPISNRWLEKHSRRRWPAAGSTAGEMAAATADEGAIAAIR